MPSSVLCQRTLSEVGSLVSDSSKTGLERFHELYQLVGDRNYDIARGFDDPKRSTVLEQLAFMKTPRAH